jgi:hypothetical protein
VINTSIDKSYMWIVNAIYNIFDNLFKSIKSDGE